MSASNCLPKGVSAADYTNQLSKVSGSNGQDFLSRPLTQNDFGNAQTQSFSWLPAVVAQVGWMILALPPLALLAGAGFVLLSENKMQGLATVGRRTFWHGLVVCVLGAAIWFFGQSFQIGSFLPEATGEGVKTEQAIITNLVDPLVQRIAPDIGQVLTLLAGSVAVIGASAWLIGHIIRRKIEDQKKHFANTVSSPPPPPQQPPAPPASAM
jgi:hypothetical protein